MNKSKIELDILLDLFEKGCKNSYVSVMDLFNGAGSHLTRIELVLQNVGTLRLYQSFIENYDGEQIPDFKVFYTIASNKNISTKITDKQLLNKAISIVYKTKKYMESNPETLTDNDDLFGRATKNKKLALKLYEKQFKKRSPFFQMIYNGK